MDDPKSAGGARHLSPFGRAKRLERFFSYRGHALEGSLHRLRDFDERGVDAVMRDNVGLTRADLEWYAAGPAQRAIAGAMRRIQTAAAADDVNDLWSAAREMRTQEIRLKLIERALTCLDEAGQ